MARWAVRLTLEMDHVYGDTEEDAKDALIRCLLEGGVRGEWLIEEEID